MNTTSLQVRMKRLFTEGFTAIDIVESLTSFDAEKKAAYTRQFVVENNMEVVGVTIHPLL